MNNAVKKIFTFAFVAIATASLLASAPIPKNQPVLAANLCGSGLNCGSSNTGTNSTGEPRHNTNSTGEPRHTITPVSQSSTVVSSLRKNYSHAGAIGNTKLNRNAPNSAQTTTVGSGAIGNTKLNRNAPNLRVAQTSTVGSFSGEFHEESDTGGGGHIHILVTLAGPMASNDGRNYVPSGTWQVSFDWLAQEGGVVQGSYSYTGTASPDVNAAHVVSVLPSSIGVLTFDPASNTFDNSPIAEVNDHSQGQGLQGWSPCNVGGPNPLSGSDALGDDTCSWTFNPGTTPPQNQPPVAVAGPDQSVNSGDKVTLNGTGSYDPDPGDSVVSYQWSSSNSSITLNGADTPTPTFTAPNVDKDTKFTIQLVVTDTHGAQSQPDTVDVLVKAPLCTNTPSATTTNRETAPSNLAIPSSPPSPSVSIVCKPIANAGPPQTVDSLAPVTLDGSGSSGVQPLTYSWTASSNDITLIGANTPNPTFKAPLVKVDTTYQITLIVTSFGISSFPDSVNIKVLAPTVDVNLDHASTRPKTVAVRFTGIPPVYGFHGNMHTQPQVDGGDVNVQVHLKGIYNPQTIPIRLSFDPRLDSDGGHVHLTAVNDNARRAFGGFVTPTNNNPRISITANPDTSGLLAATFRPVNLNNAARSSASAGLNIIATAQIPGFTAAQQPSHATDLTTEVGGLEALPAGTSYDLVGNRTGLHIDNHYGTPAVVTALQNIADDYYNAFHRVRNTVTHGMPVNQQHMRLRYNDMSLIAGGLFDINGQWGASGGHATHTCGVDADVGITDATRTFSINEDDLRYNNQ